MADAGHTDASAPLPERRGWLINEYTGEREYFILRGGVLRIRQSPRGLDCGSLYLAHGSNVTLLANGVIEVSSKVPLPQEYILRASRESEVEGWHDAIHAAIRSEQAKMDRLKELMEDGCTMHKYNYSNSKRSRRYFWVADEGKQLCWGRSKGVDTQSVNLRECIGIIYGPMTTTFQRCQSMEDPSWTCFSLLFMGRTLDLTVNSDLQVHAWFLGLQHLISLHGIGSMPMMSDAQFMARKVQYKIMVVAHRQGLVLGRYLLDRLRTLAAGRGLTGLGGGGGVGGGGGGAGGGGGGTGGGGGAAAVAAAAAAVTSRSRLSAGSSASVPPASGDSSASGATKEGKKLRKRDSALADDGADGRTSALRSKVLQMQELLRERNVQAEAAEALLKQAASLPAEGREAALQTRLRDAALESLKTRCSTLAAEAGKLAEAAEQMAPQVKAAEKTDRSLRKLQQKLDESEAKRSSLERDLSAARASAEASSGAKKGTSSAEAEACKRNQKLEQQVKELELKLQQVRERQNAEAEGAKNREQDEAIAAAEAERLSLQQRFEERTREAAKVRQEEEQLSQRLVSMQALNQKLAPRARQLQAAVGKLRDNQRQAKEEVQSAKQNFGSNIAQLVEGTSKLAQESKIMEEKYKAAMEDRKRLHNQVLDLKGNIRVFVRVRPINAKELPSEPEGEATVSFRDDTNIGIYDGQHSRRKWFEFDQVFSPDTQQAQVFEEAKPLATSVLDGYNVCVFAYGQTGSGKTHTMTGNTQDPGLNTNVLKELFRMRDERKNEWDINISIAITEIYNETVRDLLSPSPKKLDVKMNSDGTTGVPGLTELKVANVQDVMKCISDASKNRATSTTDMNEQSSRSHSIVTVRTQCTLKGGDTYVGKIHLIDLAGSENTNKSGVTGQGMKEAQNINKSLSALGDVIQSLVAKNPHTPYRNSKLTMMLKDSLGGDSKTLMIVCSSPAQTNVTETLSSLNFAARARNVELGKAKRNTAPG